MAYALPILILCLTIASFFLIARGHYRQLGAGQVILRILAALPLLLSALVLHFLRPAECAAIIPPGFPDPPLLVFISGIFEIAGAIGLFIPRLRRTAAFLISLMMIAIFPANIYAAGKTIGGLHMPAIPVRTAMQVVYILLVLISGYGLPRRLPIHTDP